jgi:hypothetical protein
MSKSRFPWIADAHPDVSEDDAFAPLSLGAFA